MSLKPLNIAKIILFLLPALMYGQDRYWVFFSDKEESVSTYQPNNFLSERSIERRSNQGIEIVENDYPISPSYIKEVESLGFKVYRASRWLNAVSVSLSASEDIASLKGLTFVKKIRKINRYHHSEPKLQNHPHYRSDATPYGASYGQIAQLNGHLVHEQGHMGQGIVIAVMDASFYLVDELFVFDSLWANNRILDTWDFVLDQDVDYDINTIGSHGTMVLSCMGGYMEGSLIGTAPEATYLLYRTEDNSSETLAEEDNWVLAAERADAQGAHVINTSLGYSNLWDDPENTHTYADMDGNTTVITRAADIAASKGMLVVNSAGNSGDNDWYYITAPADGDSVLTVGAIGSDSILTLFSSHGPTVDGRMKPNVVAQGLNTVVCDLENGIRTAKGTSFSSPILAGMAASLWSAMPEISSMRLYDFIQESGHLYPDGNNDYGYGVPDFYQVLQQVGVDELVDNDLSVYPNPFEDHLIVDLSQFNPKKEVELSIYNHLGQQVYFKKAKVEPNHRIEIDLPRAIYTLKAKQSNKEYHWRIVR